MKDETYIELRHTAQKTGVDHLIISEIARDIRTWLEDGVKSGTVEIKDKELWKEKWRTCWMADFPDDEHR